MLSRHLRTHLVVAPSTSVGKSIFSTGLVRASLALGERVGYLKPVGTGSGDGDDELHLQKFAPKAKTACLFHFDEPVSPHLAVERAEAGGEGAGSKLKAPTDREFAQAVGSYARSFAGQTTGQRSSLYIESAGGVHSPTLSGTSQLDAFRPLLPPTLLIASHALGGISTTISAYESLLLRGYDVDAVLVFREAYYANHEYFSKWFGERGIKVGVVDQPPQQVPSAEEDAKNLEAYYSTLEGEPLQPIIESLQQTHLQRIKTLETAPRRTLDSVWWPFVQHGLVKNEKDVMVIDSAHGDTFSVFSDSNSTPSAAVSPVLPPSTQKSSPSSPSTSSSPQTSLLNPVFDGSASWWTQCLGHSNPELTLAAAHSAGRFGHVMFPTATNLPALNLAERLLSTVGQGWANRVFFSDNGSTGMEVALKMALRAFADREELNKEERKRIAVLGLKGSYHGDTIGAMDACEGGVYSERVEWYEGRGYWLESPSIRIEKGKVVVTGTGGRTTTYETLQEIYDVDRRVKEDPLAQVYREEIESDLEERLAKGDIKFGTLILEPVIMGAGGMIVVDPLYQRTLIDVVRTNRKLFPSVPSSSYTPSSPTATPTPVWTGLPVIFDEVFTGLYRLGRQSASSFLGTSTKPDISCYAKILTGGLVPMSVTLASDAIFKSFLGENKVDALLHGHSYTAHAVGCGVANKTLEILERMEEKQDGEWNKAKEEWSTSTVSTLSSTSTSTSDPVWSLWSSSFVHSLSSHPRISGTLSLGTVLILHLSSTSSGYTSTASESFLRRLRTQSKEGLFEGIHARPLGNVVYFMSSLNSDQGMLRAVEKSILEALNAEE
ncbi:uncharacterized protein JCM6883_005512 [Sporobolomyces salmoneus]|uniref:uncharacterized protein n=1 Tax=Sporobolomyces salmoneus TaxID=183962 RepID=UPI003174121B